MATIRQKKAITNLVENGGNISKAMRDAGYTEATSHTPQKLTESVGAKKEIESFVSKMEKERDRLIVALVSKDLDQERYQTMIDGLDKLTKNIQLLNGGVTERQSLKIEFDEVFKNK